MPYLLLHATDYKSVALPPVPIAIGNRESPACRRQVRRQNGGAKITEGLIFANPVSGNCAQKLQLLF
jgi:hypothetical protein